MVRAYLAVVGMAYLILSAWCVAAPESTARAVGFTLTPGSGQSEYLVVYGGLQAGLGMLFLGPVVFWTNPRWPLAACLVIHMALVVFRTMSFFRFSGIGSTTYGLAAVEWLIALSAIAIWWKTRDRRDTKSV